MGLWAKLSIIYTYGNVHINGGKRNIRIILIADGDRMVVV